MGSVTSFPLTTVVSQPLADLAALTPTDNAVIVGNGTNFTATSALDGLAVTGSTINSTPIGGSSRSSGNFTSVDASTALASPNVVLQGSSSGTTTVNALAAASGTMTVPSGTDRLVARNTTDTLTNKTLTSPVVNTPTITGGTIDNTPIGGTTRSSGNFTGVNANAGVTSNTLVLNGSSSGTTTVNAAATASGTLTLPAATDTLVGKATTDTLTNKTLTTPTINGAALSGTISGTPTLSGANYITNANLVQTGAATLKGNPTGSTANASDFTIQGLTNLVAPDANLDYVPIYDHSSGTIKNVTPGAIASSATAGVSSIDGVTGVVITAGSISMVGSVLTAEPANGAGNIALNGNMEISQFNGSNAVNMVSGTDQYIVDQHVIGFKNSTMVVTGQKVVPPGSPSFGSAFSSCLQIKATTGASLAVDSYVGFHHAIEGVRFSKLGWGTAAAQPVTVSFWVYATIAGNMAVSFRNAAVNRCYVTSVTVNSPLTWEYKTVTIPGDTSGTWPAAFDVGSYLGFFFGSGSDWQQATDSWAAANKPSFSGNTNFFASNNNVVCFTGIGVWPGSVAPTAEQSPWLVRPSDEELYLCRRHYQKSYAYATLPATAYTVSTAPSILLAGTNPIISGQPFPVPMRATPTLTFYDAAGNAGKLSRFASAAWTNNNAPTGSAVNEMKFWVQYSETGVSLLSFEYVADARLPPV